MIKLCFPGRSIHKDLLTQEAYDVNEKHKEVDMVYQDFSIAISDGEKLRFYSLVGEGVILKAISKGYNISMLTNPKCASDPVFEVYVIPKFGSWPVFTTMTLSLIYVIRDIIGVM